MSETRRPLGSLGSEMNVGGPDALRRRAGPELNPLDRHTRRVRERREEAWRPLNKHRVGAFIRMLVLYVVETENGHPRGPHPEIVKILQKALITRIIPWIHFRLVYTLEERRWPITLAQFRELNGYLADHLPRIQKEDQWDAIRYFYEEVVRQRDELKRLDEMEREAMESVRRCLGQ